MATILQYCSDLLLTAQSILISFWWALENAIKNFIILKTNQFCVCDLFDVYAGAYFAKDLQKTS